MIKINPTIRTSTAFTSATMIAHNAKDANREERRLQSAILKEIRSAEKACGAPKGTLSGEIIDGLAIEVKKRFQQAREFIANQGSKLIK